MEASAGLVAGSHNRNELVVIHGHEEVMNLIDQKVQWEKVLVCLFVCH